MAELPEGFTVLKGGKKALPEGFKVVPKREPINPIEGSLRAYLQGGTFGFGDEAVGGGAAVLSPLVHGDDGAEFGERYEAYQGREQDRVNQFREENPIAAYGSEIAGSIPTILMTGGAGAYPTIARLMIAAGQGGAYGFGASEADNLADRGKDAAFGAATGAATEGALGWLGKWLFGAPARKAAREAVPTAEEIKDVGHAGYQAAEDSGVKIRPEALNLFDQDVRELLQQRGLFTPSGKLPSDFGKLKRSLKLLGEYKDAPMTVAQWQRFREGIQEIARSKKTGQADIGQRLLEKFDGFIDSLPASAYVGEGGEDAAAAWARGKADWARYRRTEAIEDAVYNARMTVGGDIATNLRSQIGTLLKTHRKQSQGFSDAEIKAMEKFVEGGGIGEMMRSFAQGGGLPAGVFGGLAAGPVGAAVGLGASAAAKKLGARAARRGVDDIRAQVATGGIPQRTMPGGLMDLERLFVSGGQGGQMVGLDDTRDYLSDLFLTNSR